MKNKQFLTPLLTALFTIGLCVFSLAQQGTVVINEDPTIKELLELKKDINKDEKNSDRYKIQIYYGDRSTAENRKSKFDTSVGKWQSQLVYESPNYKIWIGSFRSRLEADRALVDVQKRFPDAFIFKPKKD